MHSFLTKIPVCPGHCRVLYTFRGLDLCLAGFTVSSSHGTPELSTELPMLVRWHWKYRSWCWSISFHTALYVLKKYPIADVYPFFSDSRSGCSMGRGETPFKYFWNEILSTPKTGKNTWRVPNVRFQRGDHQKVALFLINQGPCYVKFTPLGWESEYVNPYILTHRWEG